jgi:hypothetical protein
MTMTVAALALLTLISALFIRHSIHRYQRQVRSIIAETQNFSLKNMGSRSHRTETWLPTCAKTSEPEAMGN